VGDAGLEPATSSV